jgi:hypothetical protein
MLMKHLVFSENVKTTKCSTGKGSRTHTARMLVRQKPCVVKYKYLSITWKYVSQLVMFDLTTSGLFIPMYDTPSGAIYSG